MAVKTDMAMVRSYDQQILLIEKELEKQVKKTFERDYKLLQTVPGVGRILALSILFEMDAVSRFPTVKDFVSYSRLVKGSVASAGKVKGLSGGKMGNAYLRWTFGQVAIIAKRSHPLISEYADRLISKHGKFKGNAILANKLARTIYFMLQKGTVFDVERVVATSL